MQSGHRSIVAAASSVLVFASCVEAFSKSQLWLHLLRTVFNSGRTKMELLRTQRVNDVRLVDHV